MLTLTRWIQKTMVKKEQDVWPSLQQNERSFRHRRKSSNTDNIGLEIPIDRIKMTRHRRQELKPKKQVKAGGVSRTRDLPITNRVP